jgi:hypothetical protein
MSPEDATVNSNKNRDGTPGPDRQAEVEGKPVYSLSVREGGAEANLSLQKLLEVNYGRKLPDFAGNEEDTPSSIEAYIEQVRAAVEGLKRWQVRRWLVLGHFSFGRFAMYSDLEPQKWGNPVAHDLVPRHRDFDRLDLSLQDG